MNKRKKQRGCVGKKRFEAQHEVLGFINSFYAENSCYYVGYKCQFCKKWHVATKKYYKEQNPFDSESSS